MKKASVLFVLSAVVVVCACKKNDDNNNGSSINATDRNFIAQASFSNYDEINAGRAASSKAERDSVKMFGQMMVDDHTMAQRSLDSIGGALNITTPATADSMHMAMLQQMNSYSGHMFDTAYIHSQVMDHQTAINLFQDELNNGSNQRIKNYVNQYLPKIQMHYNMATQLSAGE